MSLTQENMLDLNQIRGLIMKCLTNKNSHNDDGHSNTTKTGSNEDEGDDENARTSS